MKFKKTFSVWPIKTYEKLKDAFDSGETVYCVTTGGWGEDDNAIVIGAGKVKDYAHLFEYDLDEIGYDSEEEFLQECSDFNCIVIDKYYGQSSENFCIPELDGRGELAEEIYMYFGKPKPYWN